MKTLVELLKTKSPTIEIITTATSNPAESFIHYRKAFIDLGCIDVGHIDLQDRESVMDEKIIRRMKNAVVSCFQAVTRQG